MLHRRRYLLWAKQPTKTESQVALQYAMWAMAASLSTHFQHIRDSLYQNAKDILDELELRDCSIGHNDVEQAQAWILLAVFELMRKSYRLGWITAGRCFRMVQMMRLYELDSPITVADTFGTASEEDWVEKEEKRRAFWVAYCLDRFLSISNEWPLTINEYMVCNVLRFVESSSD
jgi:hypothetical protein